MKRISVGVAVTVLSVATLSLAQQPPPQPWPMRAHAVLAQMLQGPTGVSIAQSVQRITHPSGGEANLAHWHIDHVGETLSVRLTVNWSGALGGEHKTVVAWDFDYKRHRNAAILSDDAPIQASGTSSRQLDAYFRDSIYPMVRRQAGN